MKLLAELLMKEHLEYLGPMEWGCEPQCDQNLCLKCPSGIFYSLHQDPDYAWYVKTFYRAKEKYVKDWVTNFQASCILEHFIRVKLGNVDIAHDSGGYYFVTQRGYTLSNNPGNYEEALIAAMDYMIAKEKA